MRDYNTYKTYEKMYTVTWDQLVELEPELDRMLLDAECAGEGWRTLEQVDRRFSPFKNPIHKRVGFCGKHRGHPILGTQGAYDVTYWRLRNAVAGDHRAD